ncbi:hypothetical protein CLF_110547 [Clonorchis sinensis]|uniref:Uncharacterized protein n=1 Tax=Clonorchis sinensis TaxID=79923 RepID=G7YKU3_CLOSI|nr:hypothetical protein CLF_110547 [Clonorchis sinensis]
MQEEEHRFTTPDVSLIVIRYQTVKGEIISEGWVAQHLIRVYVLTSSHVIPELASKFRKTQPPSDNALFRSDLTERMTIFGLKCMCVTPFEVARCQYFHICAEQRFTIVQLILVISFILFSTGTSTDTLFSIVRILFTVNPNKSFGSSIDFFGPRTLLNVRIVNHVFLGTTGKWGRHHRLLHASKPVDNASTSSEPEVFCALNRGSRLSADPGVTPVNFDTHAREVTTYAFLNAGSDIMLVKRDPLAKNGVTSMASDTLGGSMGCTSKANDSRLLSTDESQSIDVDRAFVVDSLPMRAVPSIREAARTWPHLKEVAFDEFTSGHPGALAATVRLGIRRHFSTEHWSLFGGSKSTGDSGDWCDANSVTAKCFVNEISDLVSKGDFRMRNWSSNDRGVLSAIDPAELTSGVRNLTTVSLPMERALGVQWDTESDTPVVAFNLPTKPPTRRGVRSCISLLRDFLGFVSLWLIPGYPATCGRPYAGVAVSRGSLFAPLACIFVVKVDHKWSLSKDVTLFHLFIITTVTGTVFVELCVGIIGESNVSLDTDVFCRATTNFPYLEDTGVKRSQNYLRLKKPSDIRLISSLTTNFNRKRGGGTSLPEIILPRDDFVELSINSNTPHSMRIQKSSLWLHRFAITTKDRALRSSFLDRFPPCLSATDVYLKLNAKKDLTNEVILFGELRHNTFSCVADILLSETLSDNNMNCVVEIQGLSLWLNALLSYEQLACGQYSVRKNMIHMWNTSCSGRHDNGSHCHSPRLLIVIARPLLVCEAAYEAPPMHDNIIQRLTTTRHTHSCTQRHLPLLLISISPTLATYRNCWACVYVQRRIPDLNKLNSPIRWPTTARHAYNRTRCCLPCPRLATEVPVHMLSTNTQLHSTSASRHQYHMASSSRLVAILYSAVVAGSSARGYSLRNRAANVFAFVIFGIRSHGDKLPHLGHVESCSLVQPSWGSIPCLSDIPLTPLDYTDLIPFPRILTLRTSAVPGLDDLLGSSTPPVLICDDSLTNPNYKDNPKRFPQDVHVRGCPRTQVRRRDDDHLVRIFTKQSDVDPIGYSEVHASNTGELYSHPEMRSTLLHLHERIGAPKNTHTIALGTINPAVPEYFAVDRRCQRAQLSAGS